MEKGERERKEVVEEEEKPSQGKTKLSSEMIEYKNNKGERGNKLACLEKLI